MDQNCKPLETEHKINMTLAITYKTDLINKSSQKPLNNSKQSATNAIKPTSKRANLKAAEATGDLICNKIADEISKVWRTSPQNSSEAVTNEAENIELIVKYL